MMALMLLLILLVCRLAAGRAGVRTTSEPAERQTLSAGADGNCLSAHRIALRVLHLISSLLLLLSGSGSALLRFCLRQPSQVQSGPVQSVCRSISRSVGLRLAVAAWLAGCSSFARPLVRGAPWFVLFTDASASAAAAAAGGNRALLTHIQPPISLALALALPAASPSCCRLHFNFACPPQWMFPRKHEMDESRSVGLSAPALASDRWQHERAEHERGEKKRNRPAKNCSAQLTMKATFSVREFYHPTPNIVSSAQLWLSSLGFCISRARRSKVRRLSAAARREDPIEGKDALRLRAAARRIRPGSRRAKSRRRPRAS